MMMTGPTGFQHEALLYECPDEFLRATVPFVRDAVASGHPTLVALEPTKSALLREALPDTADGVQFVDMTAVGRNPARLIPVWDRFVAEHGAGRPLRGVGEPVWPGRAAEEVVECHHHEALLNVAFADTPDFSLLCPYDASALDRGIISSAERTHPFVYRDGQRDPSPSYGSTVPEQVLREPLPPPPPRRATLPFDTVRTVRPFVSREAEAAGAGPDQVADIVLAVNEVAANSLVHGGGTGELSVWQDRGTLLCEVRDGGRVTDPLVGRRPPPPDRPDGRGLYVVNHLCDVVQIRTSPRGTTTRLHFRSIGGPG